MWRKAKIGKKIDIMSKSKYKTINVDKSAKRQWKKLNKLCFHWNLDHCVVKSLQIVHYSNNLIRSN